MTYEYMQEKRYNLDNYDNFYVLQFGDDDSTTATYIDTMEG